MPKTRRMQAEERNAATPHHLRRAHREGRCIEHQFEPEPLLEMPLSA